MRAKPKAESNFSDALRKVLSVSHDQMKAMLDAEKERKKRKPKPASSSRVSNAKPD